MSPAMNPPPRMVCIIFVAGHNDRLEKEIAKPEEKIGKYYSAEVTAPGTHMSQLLPHAGMPST